MGPHIISIIARSERPVYEWLHVAQLSSEPHEADDIPFHEAEANARLIAAAPDLLAALQDTLRMLEAAHRELGMFTAHNKRIIAARAAIAKATGES